MFFDFNSKKIFRFTLAALLPLLAIKTQEYPPHDEWFEKPFSYSLSFIQETVFSFLSGSKNILETYLFIINTNQRNQLLTQINSDLMARSSTLEDFKQENDELRTLLDLKKRSPMTLLAAESISTTSDLLNNSFWINKGDLDGVKIGQAVLSKNTIIGSIIRVLNRRSQVLLITDRFSVLDGIVARTRAKGIIEGLGNDLAVFKSFEKLTDLSVGDEIVSAGVDQVFPKGIRVATVKKLDIDRETGLPKAILESHFDSAKLEKVFITISGSDIDHGFWSEESP
jgi:rod shape-determining protein MreC